MIAEPEPVVKATERCRCSAILVDARAIRDRSDNGPMAGERNFANVNDLFAIGIMLRA
jgi:hypothetical protein